MPPNEKIILFDDICNLCNRVVLFIIKRDPQAKYMFASLQSDSGKKILLKFGISTSDFDSFVLINDNKYFSKSSASLRVFKELNGLWRLLFVFIIVPPFMRDFIYNIIAKNRYKVFGKRDSCMVPSPAIQNRFLQ